MTTKNNNNINKKTPLAPWDRYYRWFRGRNSRNRPVAVVCGSGTTEYYKRKSRFNPRKHTLGRRCPRTCFVATKCRGAVVGEPHNCGIRVAIIISSLKNHRYNCFRTTTTTKYARNIMPLLVRFVFFRPFSYYLPRVGNVWAVEADLKKR
jgi:hypothetical protein